MVQEESVGIVGLGRMGRALAAELAADEVDLVVYNRSVEVAQQLADELGAVAAPTARELAAQSTIVLVLVADGPALLDVLAGVDGLVAGLQPGCVVADMGTSGIEHTERARSILAAAGVPLVEAPVSGSVPTIRTRSLLTMLGGEDAAVARVTPVLDIVSKSVVHVGGPGSGAAMKLAVNSVLFGLNQAVAEALVLCEQAGIDRRVAYDVFANSAVGAPAVAYRRDAFVEPGTTEVTFALGLGIKDLDLVADLAAQVGAELPQCAVNRAVLAKAAAAGLGDADLADVAVWLRSVAGGAA
jgi:3-hydroxyisobutyrate dehydrogenase/2-hydroxy-3-oxopropionate reductase